MFVNTCVCVCVHACVRVCVCVYERACVREHVCEHVHVGMLQPTWNCALMLGGFFFLCRWSRDLVMRSCSVSLLRYLRDLTSSKCCGRGHAGLSNMASNCTGSVHMAENTLAGWGRGV